MATPVLDDLSKAEKLRLMEALWADLSADAASLTSPSWHAGALAESEDMHASGHSRFVDWQQAKRSLREP